MLRKKKILNFTGSLFCTVSDRFSIKHTGTSKNNKITDGYSHGRYTC